MIGFFVGLFVAGVLSLAITIPLQPGNGAALIIGMVLSLICTGLGAAWDGRRL